MEANAFLGEVEGLVARDGRLAPIEAAVLAALGLGIASDSRTFAKIFGVAHALALRAILALSDGYGLVEATARDPRTQRTKLALTATGRALFDPPPQAIAA